MAIEEKPRSAFSSELPPQAPEVPAGPVTPAPLAAGAAPRDQETMLLCGLRLMQRVSAGGTVTALERAALKATAEMLEQLSTDCADVLSSLAGNSGNSKSAGSSARRGGRKKSTKKKDGDGSGLQ